MIRELTEFYLQKAHYRLKTAYRGEQETERERAFKSGWNMEQKRKKRDIKEIKRKRRKERK